MIYFLEDDPSIRKLVIYTLNSQGMEAEGFELPSQFWAAMERQLPSLVLLDLMLPEEDGLHILKRIRAGASTARLPVILITAKGTEYDKVVGLDGGADDYIAKPFNPRELLARIHAVLRRRPAADAPGAPSRENEVVSFGAFTLDLGTRVLKKNGEPVPLTTGEFAVLKAFARHPRTPLSRDKLMEMARGREYEAFDRSLDVQVSRLRKLIEPDPSKPRYLQTVWGLGYVFIPDDPAPEEGEKKDAAK